jgi:hypothetical protein
LTGFEPFELITRVAFDVALVLPLEFVAITSERIVWPTSAEVSVYFLLFAPPICAQFAPALPQRSHS